MFLVKTSEEREISMLCARETYHVGKHYIFILCDLTKLDLRE